MAELVRFCTPEDIPEVASLFTRVFLRKNSAPPQSLVSYLDELFLRQPDHDPEIASRVFVDDGARVRGFIGVLPRRMVLHGRPVRAAAGSSLMVEDPEQRPLAGARLVRAFLKGPQDITFSESANAVSQRLWVQVGAERLPTASMDWFRVLRPTGFASWKAARTFAPLGLLKPLSRAADRVLASARPGAFGPPTAEGGWTERDIGADELAAVLPELTAHYPLRPDWQRPGLDFLLAHAAAKPRQGTLYKRLVSDRAGRPSGCYLYYVRAGGLGTMLQVVARPGAAGATLDSLLRHAWDAGAVGVRGRSQHDLLDALLDRKCLFVPLSATLVHAREKSVQAAIRAEGGLVTGLAGEGWCRLIGGEFN